MIVRSRIHSFSQSGDWIGHLTSIDEGNYCVKGRWEPQVNTSKSHTAPRGKTPLVRTKCVYAQSTSQISKWCRTWTEPRGTPTRRAVWKWKGNSWSKLVGGFFVWIQYKVYDSCSESACKTDVCTDDSCQVKTIKEKRSSLFHQHLVWMG